MTFFLPLAYSDSAPGPLTYNLGEHTLTIEADGTIELADTQAAMQLSADETYKLLITLQSLFV